MAHLDQVPYLLYTTPADPDTSISVALDREVTCIGKLRPEEVEPPGAGLLQLDLPTISARHAQIVRSDEGYVLHNWKGRHGIGLYERELQPGQSHLLSHCDLFRLPAIGACVRLQFLEGQQTQVPPLLVDHPRRQIAVFGQRISFTPLEYQLVTYLHQHSGQLCSYDTLIAALWSKQNLFERKNNLEVLLHDVRAKFRAASHGFTLLETVRGQGVRLVV